MTFGFTKQRTICEVFVPIHQKKQNGTDRVQQRRRSKDLDGVHERSQQLAVLQLESFNRYRHLADAVPHIIWKLQTNGSLEYCNRQWINYSCLTLEQSADLGWQKLVHPVDLGRLLKLLKPVSDANEGFETECRLMEACSQSYQWHILRAVPERSSSGEALSWIVTNTNIEDRKKIEEALVKANQVSAAASQAKSAFLANMSHEIRTPLGIVLGYADLLADSGTPEVLRQEYLENVKRNGELLSRLIGDILDLSKIEAGYLDVEKVVFSLPDFLRTAIDSFRNQANEKNVVLKTMVSRPIPETICSDPMRLRQIFFNIVSNAIKFTESGDVTIRVDFECEVSGCDVLKIYVIDQGLGITEEQGQRLFQPFIQADSSTTRKYGGTGLGLSLSRRLARQLDGDVVLVKTEPGGKGSTFAITIGVGDLSGVALTDNLELPAQVRRSGPSENRILDGVHILIVDDAPENQFLLKHFLAGAGANVEVADNGQDGVQKALTTDFDLILMDIQMPILDGYRATRELRNRAFVKPILALTACALKEERARCMEAGCNDHLTKPINRSDLLTSVSKYIPSSVRT